MLHLYGYALVRQCLWEVFRYQKKKLWNWSTAWWRLGVGWRWVRWNFQTEKSRGFWKNLGILLIFIKAENQLTISENLSLILCFVFRCHLHSVDLWDVEIPHPRFTPFHEEWPMSEYDILNKNCCHFCEDQLRVEWMDRSDILWLVGRVNLEVHHIPTLPETNIFAPENGWLEYDRFLLGWPICRGYVSFRGVNSCQPNR